MKKTLLFLTLLGSINAASAQYNVANGTVTDCDGNPVAGHAVSIVADTIPFLGYYYSNVVYTDGSGFYVDTIPYPGGVSPFIVGTTDLGSPYAWHSQNHTASSSGNIFTTNFTIACADSVPPSVDTITATIYGTLYDCSGNPLTGHDIHYVTDSAYGVFNYGTTWSDFSTASYSFDVHYSGATTFPFPVYIYVNNAPYPGYTIDTVYVNDTTVLHDIHMECPPVICTASFWAYHDSTGMMGNDTLYLFLNYTSANPASTTVAWDFGDGTTATGINTVHEYSASGIYNVCVTVDNPVDSCTYTYCDSITYVTRSSGFVVKTMLNASMGIKDPVKEENTFSVYPNPASDLLQIKSNATIHAAQLIDMSGRQVMRQQTAGASSQLSLDIHSIEKGSYLLLLYNENNELLHTHTVLKQ